MTARRWLIQLVRLVMAAALAGPPVVIVANGAVWVGAVWLTLVLATLVGRATGWDAAYECGRRLAVLGMCCAVGVNAWLVVLVFVPILAAGLKVFDWPVLIAAFVAVMLYGMLLTWIADCGREVDTEPEAETCSTSRSGSPRSRRTPGTSLACVPPPGPASTSSAGSGSASTTAA